MALRRPRAGGPWVVTGATSPTLTVHAPTPGADLPPGAEVTGRATAPGARW